VTSTIDHDWVSLGIKLLELYALLLGGVLLGILVGRRTPESTARNLGNFIFWLGAPFTIAIFMYGTVFSGWAWFAPVIAWATMLTAGGLGWVWINCQGWFGRGPTKWPLPTQGSFLLATMAGNTGYLGYPIALVLVDQAHFGSALLYDLLGTALGTYGLGVAIAIYFGGLVQTKQQLAIQLLKNPPLWGLAIGFGLRQVAIPAELLLGLRSLGWGVMFSSLLLIGIRLSQLSVRPSFSKLLPSLGIKMLLMPLVTGLSLTLCGVDGNPRLVIVLQTAMPAAFSTLVLAEVYQLDQDLAVSVIVTGSLGLLLLLPLWLWLFGA
jgi:malate permease and related proteins